MSTLAELFPAGGGKTANFTADGAIASGKPVRLNSDGTISEISSSSESASFPLGSSTEIIASSSVTGTLDDMYILADPFNHNRWLMVWFENQSNATDYTKCRFITRSNNSLTLGTERTIFSGGGNNDDRPGATICWCTHTANQFLIGHCMDTSGGHRGSMTLVTVSSSGTDPTISVGSPYRWTTDQVGVSRDTFIPIGTTGKYIMINGTGGNSGANANIFTVTGTTITKSSTTELFARAVPAGACGFAINPWDTTKGVAIGVPSSGSSFYVRPFTLDGTTITMGTERQLYYDWQTTYKYGTEGVPHVSYVSEDQIYITLYMYETDIGTYQTQAQKYYKFWHSTIGEMNSAGTEFDNITGEDGTWTGWTPDWVDSNTSESTFAHTSISPNTPKTVVGAYVHAPYNETGYIRARVGTVNTANNTVSYGTDTQMDSSYEAGYTTQNELYASMSHGEGGYFLIMWKANNGSGYVRLGKAGGTYSNYQDLMTGAGGHIGIANAAISDGASGGVTLKGGIVTSLSNLTIGTDYYLQTDGSVGTTATAFKLGRALSATTIDLEYQS